MREEKYKHIRFKKALAGFLVVCFVLSILTVFPVYEVKGDISNTRTFPATMLEDGYLYKTSAQGYDYVHNIVDGIIYNDQYSAHVGQYYSDPSYNIRRSFIFFDTSALPDSATVDSAILSLYVGSDQSATEFNVTLQTGGDMPHIPLETTDYYFDFYSNNGGYLDTSTLSGSGFYNITLNGTGEGWVETDDITKFVLRSSRDINSIAPTGIEYITFNTAESSEYGLNPKLYITYTVASEDVYDYTFIGPYLDTGGVSSDSVSCIVYQAFNQTDSFSLDGSGGVDTIYRSYEQQPVSVIWNITNVENRTRTIYFTSVHSETLHIFVPDSDDLAYLYYFSIIDLFGMNNPYLEVLVTDQSSQQRVVQRMPVDSVNEIPFYLVFGQLYYIRIVCDEGSVVLGTFTALTSANQVLIVGSGHFSFSSNVLVPLAYALRQNNTWIQANYTDSSGLTSWVNVVFKYRNSEGNYVTSYSLNSSASSVVVNWYGAVNTTDYIADVYAYRSGDILSWGFQCPHDPLHVNPFVSLDTLEPTGSFPIRPQYLIGFSILLLATGFASYANVAMGAWVAFGFALFLSSISWLPTDPVVTPIVLGFSGVVAGLLTLAQWKSKERYM